MHTTHIHQHRATELCGYYLYKHVHTHTTELSRSYHHYKKKNHKNAPTIAAQGTQRKTKNSGLYCMTSYSDVLLCVIPYPSTRWWYSSSRGNRHRIRLGAVGLRDGWLRLGICRHRIQDQTLHTPHSSKEIRGTMYGNYNDNLSIDKHITVITIRLFDWQNIKRSNYYTQ